MIGRRSCLLLKFLSAGLAVFLLFFQGLAQDVDDPNPDSPTPVLLSAPDSTRALTALPPRMTRGTRFKAPLAP